MSINSSLSPCRNPVAERGGRLARHCKVHKVRNSDPDGARACVEDLTFFILDCPAYALIMA